ncbi:MAG: hypothetical protein AAFZ07_29770, partial [Actinomycetota bacterium]
MTEQDEQQHDRHLRDGDGGERDRTVGGGLEVEDRLGGVVGGEHPGHPRKESQRAARPNGAVAEAIAAREGRP